MVCIFSQNLRKIISFEPIWSPTGQQINFEKSSRTFCSMFPNLYDHITYPILSIIGCSDVFGTLWVAQTERTSRCTSQRIWLIHWLRDFDVTDLILKLSHIKSLNWIHIKSYPLLLTKQREVTQIEGRAAPCLATSEKWSD